MVECVFHHQEALLLCYLLQLKHEFPSEIAWEKCLSMNGIIPIDIFVVEELKRSRQCRGCLIEKFPKGVSNYLKEKVLISVGET